jgi:hypothetical protein
MKQSLILITLLFILASNIFSQTGSELFIEGNLNFFNMNDLKDFQTEILSALTSQGVPAKITNSYPAYFGIKTGFLISLSSLHEHGVRFGGFVKYMSTGGRVDYSDYSGEIKEDQVASSFSIGAIISIPVKDFKYVSLRADLQGMVIGSGFKYKHLFKIGDQQNKEEVDFSSTSAGIEPVLICFTRLGNFRVGLSLSYLITFPPELEADNYDNAYLQNKNGKRLTIDWGGFKFGIMSAVEF